ncbi:MBL fold metallo-hydrolase [Archaeoglobus veneficus]|uniref:Beta-lactamase domain protein n=1 Tax=Archaeoglobus veneficus (strain DSM 11195 / SNP6) TaxID=693661 RepID=F2KR84_ARCVS|nr:MBL fold metallo-hydrolase [Archaeoglobus veneficus]AEA46721.1 beta-lactamase domain protein [Archaeoglobus veneficus SNP6]
MYTRIGQDLYQIKPGKLSSHCYLILSEKNILIDSGTSRDFPTLQSDLEGVGVKVSDIDMVINTHEHFDHIGGNRFLQNHAIIAAHRYAAVKIVYGDDEVTMCRANEQDVAGYRIHVWLGNTDVIDAGSWFLKVLHTPGHTSGCICVYEPRKRILFSGDALFASGTLSTIFNSGSLAEYLNSLRRLSTMKIDLLLPGHGRISDNVEEDISKTVEAAVTKFPEAERLAVMLGLKESRSIIPYS